MHRHLTPVLVTAALTALIAGCGGSSDSSSDSSSSSDGSSTKAASSSGTASQGAGGQAVDIKGFAFHPGSLTVQPGKVTVSNDDSTAHTATPDSGGFDDTGDIAPGSSATIDLAKAGTFKYHCSIHPFMHGTIVVK